jgi:hypothetical protein
MSKWQIIGVASLFLVIGGGRIFLDRWEYSGVIYLVLAMALAIYLKK